MAPRRDGDPPSGPTFERAEEAGLTRFGAKAPPDGVSPVDGPDDAPVSTCKHCGLAAHEHEMELVVYDDGTRGYDYVCPEGAL